MLKDTVTIYEFVLEHKLLPFPRNKRDSKTNKFTIAAFGRLQTRRTVSYKQKKPEHMRLGVGV